MDREGKYRIDDEIKKEETELLEAIGLKIGRKDLLLESL